MPKWMSRSPRGFNLTNIKKYTKQLNKATDHKFETKTVSTGDTLNLHLAPGGGWVAILTPVK